jgi:mRNA export factor
MATCGWDCSIKVFNYQYNVQLNSAQIQTQNAFTHKTDDIPLSMIWKGENYSLITGLGNGNISELDLNTNQSILIGKHEAGVKSLIWMPNLNVCFSGGWDGKLNAWDTRAPNPVASYSFGKKIFSMSATHPLLVVGLQDRLISYFNLNLIGQKFQPEATFESHLKYQTRCVSTFVEGNGYAVGSIEGRVAIKYVDVNQQPRIDTNSNQMSAQDDFAFRCHRVGETNPEVYPVNAIAFNQIYGTFCTAGGDGSWTIWDKDSRSKLKSGAFQNKTPITAVDFSPSGDLLAYAAGYDWQKGISYDGQFQTVLKIHYCPDSDKKKKEKKK